MTLYRVLNRPLYIGGELIHPDSFTMLDWLDERGIKKLLAVVAVAEVSAPPLQVLPGWERKAARLAKYGITDTVQFLEANSDELAERIGARPSTIARWKEEVEQWLKAEPKTG